MVVPLGSFGGLSSEPAANCEVADIWEGLCSEATKASAKDSALTRAMNSAVLYHASFAHALAHRIAIKLANHDLDHEELLSVIGQSILTDHHILASAAADLTAIKDRDPSNVEILTPFLYFKGFVALQGQRVAHWLWHNDRGAKGAATRHGQAIPSPIPCFKPGSFDRAERSYA